MEDRILLLRHELVQAVDNPNWLSNRRDLP